MKTLPKDCAGQEVFQGLHALETPTGLHNLSAAFSSPIPAKLCYNKTSTRERRGIDCIVVT